MLQENLSLIFDQIKDGNNLGEKICLVGATKTVSYDVINQAVNLGLNVVAENKVQEFREKTDFIDKRAKQHFIGHLQTNKVKYLVGKVDLIHSVDSIHLGEAISRECVKKKVTQDLLVEINVGGELSKSGFNVENAFDGVKAINSLPNVCVKGLMAMLPKSDDKTLLAKLCLQMRSIYDTLIQQGYPLTYLSVGMSADYTIAINNGSNMIRLGSSIFGKRNYGENN